MCRYQTHITIYNLKPATTYYYFVTEDGFNSYDPLKIGPIHSFKTEDLNLAVDMGGAIVWCGVNYLENRDEFHLTQFLSNYLFRYNELPEPTYETIQGNWRYPTKQELLELAETSTVTMVDFYKEFVRLTSAKGVNLYIPFTYQKWGDGWTDGYTKLMLIPANDKDSGLYLRTPELRLSNKIYENDFGDLIKCGDELKEFELKIADSENNECKQFFHWSYTHWSSDGSIKEKSGDEKRGIRFVREK